MSTLLRRREHRMSSGGLALNYNFLLKSGSAISAVALKGPVPTFTRASNAMSFDSAGNLAYAPHQLLENANLSSWTGSQPSGYAAIVSGTRTEVTSDLGDGVSAAQMTADNERPYFLQGLTLQIDDETAYTIGFHIEALDITAGHEVILDIAVSGGSGAAIGRLDKDDFTTPGYYAIGFYSGTSTSINLKAGIGANAGVTGSGRFSHLFHVKGFLPGVTDPRVTPDTGVRLSGPPLGRWIGTDDGDEPKYDQPRFAHDPADSNAQLGLLMEEARTEIGKQTSNLAGDQYTAINSDVPTENNTDIFGGTTADELAATSTADQQVAIHQSYTGLTAGVDTAVAAHVKTGTNATFVQLAWDSNGGGSDGCFCNFQLTGSGTKGTVTAMTAGTATFARIDLTTQGFYRCIVVGKIASGTVGRFTINIVDRIDAAKFEAADLADNDSLIVNAIDVQVGAFMTSHIPNAGGSGTSVTRAKDLCLLSVSDDFSWLNPLALTVYAEFIHFVPTTSVAEGYPFQLRGADTGAEGVRFVIDYSGPNMDFVRRTAGADGELTNQGNPISADTIHKAIMAVANNDMAISVNGAAVATDTTVDVGSEAIWILGIGHSSSGTTSWINGHVRKLKFWNVRKPNAFLVSETA